MASPLPPRRALTKLQRVRVFDGNSGRCHLCGLPIKVGEAWQADHVIARWKQGQDSIGNYRPAHISCHAEKSAAETTQRAKADAVRARHLGAKPAPPRPLQGAGFRRSEKALRRQPKQPLPPKELFR